MLNPDSTVLVWILWALAGIGIFGICVLWPRLAPRGTLTIFGRLISQVTVSALVVLAAAGTLNQQNGWYGSWTDLGNDFLGNPPVVASVKTQGHFQFLQQYNARAALFADQRTEHLYGDERAVFAKSLHLSLKSAPRGHYVSVVVPGLNKVAGRSAGQVLIWLPPTYTQESASKTTYPVIEAFVGVPGKPHDYENRIGLQRIISEAHRAAGLVQPIVVIPDYEPSGLDTECVNAPSLDMETWVAKTVPTWVLHHLRAQTGKASWATMGFSAGGYCAGVVAVLHPAQFGALMIFGGYNSPEFWVNWMPFGKRSAWPERYSLLEDLRLHPPAIDVWIEQSTADIYSISDAQSFIHAVRAPTSITTVQLKGAGHRISVWQHVMPNALEWLATSDPAFHAPLTSVRPAPSEPKTFSHPYPRTNSSTIAPSSVAGNHV